ncbi:Uncharacterised protein [Klebsiella pneumoniae subsp. rhinoscleromatis]|nr:Uncharacterised protein [Klebsiella pneumoniae subsp. rhinoscleromatis]
MLLMLGLYSLAVSVAFHRRRGDRLCAVFAVAIAALWSGAA